MKKYIVSIPLGSNGSYTFTGADADAQYSPSADCCEGNDEITRGKGSVKFNTDNAIHITKARLLSPLAPNLQAGSHIAGYANCSVAEVAGGSIVEVLADFDLCFTKWNEWERKDIYIPSDGKGSLGEMIVADSSVFYVHDFNIASDYVGESFSPCIEIELETDYLVSGSSNF